MIRVTFARIRDYDTSIFHWIRHPRDFYTAFIKKYPLILDTCFVIREQDELVLSSFEFTRPDEENPGWSVHYEVPVSLMQGLLYMKSKVSKRHWKKQKNLWAKCYLELSPSRKGAEYIDQVSYHIRPKKRSVIYSTIDYTLYNGEGTYTLFGPRYRVSKQFTGKDLLLYTREFLNLNGEDYIEEKKIERVPYYVPSVSESTEL